MAGAAGAWKSSMTMNRQGRSSLARDLVELELEAGACMMHPGEEQVMVSQEFLIDP